MQETLLIIYLVVAISLIGIILLQQGKGAEMGASFGAGGANTVFGAAGSGNVLTKTTTILAILFFATAISISYYNSEPVAVTDDILDEQPVQQEAPIESQVPTADDNIAAAVAPESKAEVKPAEATAKADEAKKAEEKKEGDNNQ